VGDFHRPAIGDWLRLAGVVRQRFEIVLEQELSLQRQLRVSVGSGDGDGESQRELNKGSLGSFHIIFGVGCRMKSRYKTSWECLYSALNASALYQATFGPEDPRNLPGWQTQKKAGFFRQTQNELLQMEHALTGKPQIPARQTRRPLAVCRDSGHAIGSAHCDNTIPNTPQSAQGLSPGPEGRLRRFFELVHLDAKRRHAERLWRFVHRRFR
jgi:hypothetical protein